MNNKFLQLLLILVLLIISSDVAGSEEVLFDSAGVYIRSCGGVGGKWSGYELIVNGTTNIEDSVFVVDNFKTLFPSLDTLDLMVTYGLPTVRSQESKTRGITCEIADSVSHFKIESFFLIKNWSENDVKMSFDQVDVEIILYGMVYPKVENLDPKETLGQKREWRTLVSVPRRDRDRNIQRNMLKYNLYGDK